MKDRTGLTVSSIRRQMGFDKTPVKPKVKPIVITPSIATAEVEELPDDFFTQPINLKNGKYSETNLTWSTLMILLF